MTTHYVRPEEALTLDHLPEHGHLVVYGTVEVWTNAALEFGNPSRSGWAATLDQPDEPAESRDHVQPLFRAPLPLNEEQREELADILAMLGAVDSENGSTIYATDTKTYDMSTDETWRYAVHASVRWFGGTPRCRHEDKVRILK